MDKRYYYRILGLREGASVSEIKEAYGKQIRKLKQPDYADDPEYVARKMDQMRHAYSVLTGASAPATRAQKEARFEKWKDALDGGEDAIEDAKKKFKRHVKSCGPLTELSAGLAGVKEKLGLSEVDEDQWGEMDAFENRKMEKGLKKPNRSGDSSGKKQTYYSPAEQARHDTSAKSRAVKFLVIGIVLLSIFGSFLTACVGFVIDSLSWQEDFLSSSGSSSVEAVPENQSEALQSDRDLAVKIEQCASGYDYYGWLDLSTQEDMESHILWDADRETAPEVYDEIWGCMTDIGYYLGFSSNDTALWAITGDEDFYWDNDDYTNSQVLIGIMDPPSFEETAGGINLYSGEVILDYADYLVFLTDVADFQTKEILQ